jgi:hypothetical protein
MLLKLTAIVPKAPTKVAMSNAVALNFTNISKFIGSTEVYTLIATPATGSLPKDYTWELPAGTNVRSGATAGNDVSATYNVTSATNEITVDFAAVTQGTDLTRNMFIGVRANNYIGSSTVTNNTTLTAPSADSPFKYLKVALKAPAAVTKVVKTGTAILPSADTEIINSAATTTTERNYTITTIPLLATRYVITAPTTDCIVTSLSNSTNNSNVLTTTDLNFKVLYPAQFTPPSGSKLKIQAQNQVGTSTALEYGIRTTATVRLAGNDNLVFETEMYPNPTSDLVNFIVNTSTNGEIEMTIYSLDGKVVMESKGLTVENGTNSFTENVSSLNKGIYLVRITNTTSNEVITKKLIKN